MLGLQRSNLTDSLISEIQKMVEVGEIRVGQRLPSETEIAARFGVGRSTVRESMKALASMGIVEICPGRGTFLKEPSQQQLADALAARIRLRDSRATEVYEARKTIEVELAALAAERATERDLDAIARALDDMRATLRVHEEFTAADVRFHLAIAQAAKNALLEQFYSFAGDLVTNVIQEITRLPNVKERSIELHAATFEAIKRRDPAAARASILKHMRYVHSVMRPAEDARP